MLTCILLAVYPPWSCCLGGGTTTTETETGDWWPEPAETPHTQQYIIISAATEVNDYIISYTKVYIYFILGGFGNQPKGQLSIALRVLIQVL